VVQVACGKTHTVVSMESGKLMAFGSNVDGQLGVGRNIDSTNKPIDIPGTDFINNFFGGNFSTFGYKLVRFEQ